MKTNIEGSGREGVRIALSSWSCAMHVKGRGEVGTAHVAAHSFALYNKATPQQTGEQRTGYLLCGLRRLSTSRCVKRLEQVA